MSKISSDLIIKPRLRKFSDCIGLPDSKIQSRISNVILIDDYQMLINNINILKK